MCIFRKNNITPTRFLKFRLLFLLGTFFEFLCISFGGYAVEPYKIFYINERDRYVH